MKARHAIAAIGMLAATTCSATEANVAGDSYLYVSSSVPETVRLEPGAVLRKSGDEALVVSSDGFAGVGWQIEAFGGSLAVTSGADRASVKPTAVLSKAAFWVDASVNVVRDGSNVLAWRDVRETSTETDSYPRATSMTNLTNEYPQFVASGAGVDGNLPSIWFGRLASGRWMQFSTRLTGLRHVFVVHGVTESYGNIIGTTDSPPLDTFLAGNLSKAKGPLFWHNSKFAAPVRGCVFLDRLRVDPTATYPKDGWQLLEVDLPLGPGIANAFYNDRSLKNNTPFGKCWAGGDNICEAVFFTAALSPAEKVQVVDYLWRKWRSRGPDFPAGAVAYNGADVTVACPQDASLSPPRNLGTGVTYVGATNLTEEGVTAMTPEGHAPIGLGAGTTLRPAYLPHAILARTGTVYTAFGDASGDIMASAAPAGKVVKSGSGSLLVENLPQETEEIAVNAGELRFAPPVRAGAAPTLPQGVVEDGDFEHFVSNWNDKNRYIFYDDTSAYGWSYAKASSTYHAQVLCHGYLMWSLPATPSGSQYITLQRDFSLSTAFVLPQAGVYQLSFLLVQRPGGNYGWHRYELLVDGTVFAQTVANTDTFRRLRYRMPRLAAGEHTLTFRSADSTDVGSGLDDVRVEWLEAGDGEVPVPNASFERCAVFDRSTYEAQTPPDGWTVTGNGGVAMQRSWFAPSVADGDRLLWLANGAAATTTVTLPSPGRYAFSAALSRARPDSSYADPLNVAAKCVGRIGETLQASFSIGLESTPKEYVFGVYTATSGNLTVPFVVSNAQNTASVAVLTVDAVRVLRLPDSLLVNGGFEEGANGSDGWELDASKFPAGAAYARAVVIPYTENVDVFGSSAYEGWNRLRIFHRGWARQTVAFPAAGDYRFVAHTCARSLYGSYAQGRNPVDVRICRGDTTNTIGTVNSYDGKFRRYVFPFRIDEPGDYVLDLQGCGNDVDDTTTFFDGLSIERRTENVACDAIVPAKARLNVAQGARVRLDFAGTNRVASVRYAGRPFSGVVDERSCPEFVAGTGALYVAPSGTVVLFR